MLGSWHLVMPMYFSLMFGEGLSAAAVALSCRAIPEPRCGQALWPWGPASLAQAVFIILPHPHLVPSGDQGPQTGIESGPETGGPVQLLPDWERMKWAACLAEYMSLLSLRSAPKEAAPGDPGPSSITFFAFSLIEGYISIVMDAETQKKYVTPDPKWATEPKPGTGRKEVEH